MKYIIEMWNVIRVFQEVQGRGINPKEEDLLKRWDNALMNVRVPVSRYNFVFDLALKYVGKQNNKTEESKNLHKKKLEFKINSIQNIVSDCMDIQIGFLEKSQVDGYIQITARGSQFGTTFGFLKYFIKEIASLLKDIQVIILILLGLFAVSNYRLMIEWSIKIYNNFIKP